MEVIQKISDHPVLLNPDGSGKARAIRLVEINYINFDIKEARVVWQEVFLDEKDQPIKDETVAIRKIVSDISNTNKVTEQGIVIEEANFPKQEGEEDEAYQERLNSMKEKGIPEFDFYISAVVNTQAIGQAISLLDQLNRFNRK